MALTIHIGIGIAIEMVAQQYAVMLYKATTRGYKRVAKRLLVWLALAPVTVH